MPSGQMSHGGPWSSPAPRFPLSVPHSVCVAPVLTGGAERACLRSQPGSHSWARAKTVLSLFLALSSVLLQVHFLARSEGQVQLETSMPGKAQAPANRATSPLLGRKLLLIPQLSSPCCLQGQPRIPVPAGLPHARLCLHQMARPTPSGCHSPPREEALTSPAWLFLSRGQRGQR